MRRRLKDACVSSVCGRWCPWGRKRVVNDIPLPWSVSIDIVGMFAVVARIFPPLWAVKRMTGYCQVYGGAVLYVVMVQLVTVMQMSAFVEQILVASWDRRVLRNLCLYHGNILV